MKYLTYLTILLSLYSCNGEQKLESKAEKWERKKKIMEREEKAFNRLREEGKLYQAKWEKVAKFETTLSAAEPVQTSKRCMITWTIKNISTADFYILKRNMPFLGNGDYCRYMGVQDSQGNVLPFRGEIASIDPDTKESFLLLKKGKSVSYTGNLATYFKLKAGEKYTLNYCLKNASMYERRSFSLKRDSFGHTKFPLEIELSSNSIAIKIAK